MMLLAVRLKWRRSVVIGRFGTISEVRSFCGGMRRFHRVATKNWLGTYFQFRFASKSIISVKGSIELTVACDNEELLKDSLFRCSLP